MFRIEMETEGLDGWWKKLIGETRRDALPPTARAGEMLVARARQKLDVRAGPSRPGDPPAKEEGALRDSIGRTGPYSRPGTVELDWGVGVGDDAERRVNDWKSKGVNVFEYASLHEVGGIASAPGYHPRRYPPRPYIRPTEMELEAAITAFIRRAL